MLTGRPLIYGEVLFDEFQDGSAVLGGAPFNVAWHLKGFGLDPLMITRIGEDDHGKRVLEAMARWGMDTRGVQRDSRRRTGTVSVQLSEGIPSFTIHPEQAFDHIDTAQSTAALGDHVFGLLYHGTLVARSDVSRHSLESLKAVVASGAFVDVNLRAPWWDKPSLAAALGRARWAKLNDEELQQVTAASGPLDVRGASVLREFDLQLLVVTLGSEGSQFISATESRREPAAPVAAMVDTVGAGDAFSAVTILGLFRGWPLALIQQRASEFASAICGQRGATCADSQFYQRYQQRWNP
jgi:fructokinase